MTATIDGTNAEDAARRDALIERLFEATLGAWDVLGVYIGDRLGLYRALADRASASTSEELAAATGTNERYVREWLEQQASSGILAVDDAAAGAHERRYTIPAGHDEALLDESSLNYIAPIGRLVVACTRPLDALLQAFRTGDGVLRRLRRRSPRGTGAVYPTDVREPHRKRVAAGDPRRRRPPSGRPAGPSGRRGLRGGTLDHRDRARVPEGARRGSGLGRGLDRRGRDAPSRQRSRGSRGVPPGRRRGRRPCRAVRPVGMVGEGAAGTGTVMRADTVRRYAEEAGFARFEVLGIENDFYRFYRLRR